MKTKLVLSAACIVMLIASTPAQSAYVNYVGTNADEWGGPMHWRYCYEVVLDPGESITAFQVAGAVALDYCHAIDSGGNSLQGWDATFDFEIREPVNLPHHTPLGNIAPPPEGDYETIYWSGPALQGGTYYFGINSGWQPIMDAGFSLYGPYVEQHADWSEPVGMGLGPVWGPVMPEPATLLLLGFGAVMLRRKRS